MLIVAAVSPHDAWQQPILRLADTVIGVAVGLAAAWLVRRAAGRSRRAEAGANGTGRARSGAGDRNRCGVTYHSPSTGLGVRAVLFDVFGTVVDWRSGIAAAVGCVRGPP